MVDSEPGYGQRVEAYRDYLRLLAQLWLPPQIRGKIDASDLVQDAMLKAYEKRDQFRGANSGQYKAWLRAILRHTLIDIVRRSVNNPEQTVCEIEESAHRIERRIQDEQSSPSGRAILAEQIESLARLLALLPEDQQKVLVLKYCLGEKVDRIAEQVQRTPAAVAGLLRRGLKKLREHFAEG